MAPGADRMVEGNHITVTGLSKGFPRGDGQILPVLEEVSFCAGAHQFCCLLGVSGCGKSTILNVIAGLVSPDSGSVHIGGKDLGSTDFRIGYVFQKPRLLNWRTARQNLEFVLRAREIDKCEWRDRTDYYIDLVGLSGFADYYPLALSGGMQQRLALARALVIGPELLLMDEPFSNLDELTARRLRRELLRIWKEERKTVLFVTHNALEAVYLADKVILLTQRPGRVMKEILVDVPRDREMEDTRLIKLQKEIVSSLGIE